MPTALFGRLSNTTKAVKQMSETVTQEFCSICADLLDQSMIKIRHCLSQLNEDQIWWRPAPELNSIGNLCLHVCGNLRQWGLVPILDAEDTRQREQEFARDARVSKNELLHDLDSIVEEAKKLWGKLGEEQLLRQTRIQGFDVNFMQAVSHTSTHFVGHTHQIITLTRLQLGADYRFQWSTDADRSNLPI